MRINPYSDDFMLWDEGRCRYILTEAALEANGTFLRQRLTFNRSTDPTAIINRHLRRVSDVIYNFIHQHSSDNVLQDALIAGNGEYRAIVYNAMLAQSEYMLQNGDLSRSVEKDKRALAVDMNAAEELTTFVPGLGSLLYTGV